MSPEVMDLARVTPAADMWGVGCITFQLLSGGFSPFFAQNRFRTMAKVLDCDYSLEQAELRKTSPEAKDFISMLLIMVCHKILIISASRLRRNSRKWLSNKINIFFFYNIIGCATF